MKLFKENLAGKIILASTLAFTLVAILPLRGQSEDVEKQAEKAATNQAAKNPGPISQRSIKIIQRAQGVFIYTYPERVGLPLDPHKDFTKKRRLTDANVIKDFRRLLTENAEFNPVYRKRCLPVWDYGIEFRDKAEGESRTFLFSFRCNTLKIHEEKVYRDFTPQRTEIYGLLKYEVNDKTSRAVSVLKRILTLKATPDTQV